VAGSHNNINVLNWSLVFNRLMEDIAPKVSYEINDNAYDEPYYLVDGIYPDWTTLVKTISNPQTEKYTSFAEVQEACGEDVERAFGVLQDWWFILRHPARTYSLYSSDHA
jgi:hypothetical protein